MAVYTDTNKQDLLVDESLQLFRDPERLFQITGSETHDHSPIIRNSNKGLICFEVRSFW